MKKMLFLAVLIGCNTSSAGGGNSPKSITPHKDEGEKNTVFWPLEEAPQPVLQTLHPTTETEEERNDMQEELNKELNNMVADIFKKKKENPFSYIAEQQKKGMILSEEINKKFEEIKDIIKKLLLKLLEKKLQIDKKNIEEYSKIIEKNVKDLTKITEYIEEYIFIKKIKKRITEDIIDVTDKINCVSNCKNIINPKEKLRRRCKYCLAALEVLQEDLQSLQQSEKKLLALLKGDLTHLKEIEKANEEEREEEEMWCDVNIDNQLSLKLSLKSAIIDTILQNNTGFHPSLKTEINDNILQKNRK